MRKFLVGLINDTSFFQNELKNEHVQNLLRNFYISNEEHRAYCLCNPNKKLELVVAYRRKENSFELRKMPGQNKNDHDIECRFRKQQSPPLGSSRKELSIAMPVTNETAVSDSCYARQILESLWFHLENEFIGSEIHKLSWKRIKEYLQLISESLQVNREALIKNLVIIIPKTKDYLTTMNFKQGKIVIAELLYANELQDGSIVINLKGTDNPIWLSPQKTESIPDKYKKILLTKKADLNSTETRRIILFTAVNSSSGQSIQANSLHTISVNQTTFKQAPLGSQTLTTTERNKNNE